MLKPVGDAPVKSLTSGVPQDAASVPLVPLAAQGGSLGDFSVAVMGYDCERVVSPIRDVDLAITVQGDSMAPEYPSGSVVLLKRVNEAAFIEWGCVYVLDTVNGVVIKRIRKGDEPDTIVCTSINPDYEPFTVNVRFVHGFYRVKMCMVSK